MQCALNRFGPGTSTTRPNNSVLSKEMNDKLSIMRAERDKQDKMWDEEPDVNNITKPKPTVHIKTNTNTKIIQYK